MSLDKIASFYKSNEGIQLPPAFLAKFPSSSECMRFVRREGLRSNARLVRDWLRMRDSYYAIDEAMYYPFQGLSPT